MSTQEQSEFLNGEILEKTPLDTTSALIQEESLEGARNAANDIPREELIKAGQVLLAASGTELDLSTDFRPARVGNTAVKEVGRTQTSEDGVRLYLNEIGRHPLLTKQDEYELGETIKNGRLGVCKTIIDIKRAQAEQPPLFAEEEKLSAIAAGAVARERFINSNLRLVVSIAKRYQDDRLPLMDIIQEGNIGLGTAVQKFDHEKGFKFSTYAGWWIRQAITRSIQKTGELIRVPINDHSAITATRIEYAATKSMTETAKIIGRSYAEVKEILTIPTVVTSLDLPLSDEPGGAQLGDTIADNRIEPVGEAFNGQQNAEYIVALLAKTIGQREAVVVALSYGLGTDDGVPLTGQEIANRLGVHLSSIEKIKQRSLATLQNQGDSELTERLRSSLR